MVRPPAVTFVVTPSAPVTTSGVAESITFVPGTASASLMVHLALLPTMVLTSPIVAALFVTLPPLATLVICLFPASNVVLLIVVPPATI